MDKNPSAFLRMGQPRPTSSSVKILVDPWLKPLCVLGALACVLTASGLTVSNTAPDRVTGISARLNADVVSTGAAVTIWYGTFDAGTNTTNWTDSVYLQNITNAVSEVVSNLTPATIYYCRAWAAEGTNEVWAPASATWTTLAGVPTNVPPAPVAVPVMVNSNGVVQFPVNFPEANNIVTVSNIVNVTIGGVALSNWVRRTYPTLMLDLGGVWTDFELRASTNNFASSAGDVYYLCSWGPPDCPDDLDVWIYFIDSGRTNTPQSLVKATHTNSILAQLVSPLDTEVSRVIVYPSHTLTPPYSAVWMNETNTDVTWSYLRYDVIGPETNAVGTKIWRPVVPVSWKQNRP
ncbi:MAG: hypothetical protein NTV49_05425 [Kiritimatiellaeota bacterium]|nr:hypothetical protein [Kiritimatiellota bacterium]